VIILAREPLLLGTVGFNLHASRAAIGGTEIDALRVLGPHFRRAVTISNLFDMQAIETKTIASVLDALSAGVILVDDALGIVHANAAGEAMLAARARGPVQSERGIFALRSKPANDALKAAVAQAANDEAAMGQRGIGIPAGETDGEAKVIHVLPLRRSERRRGLVQRAVAALFIAPIGSPPRFPGDALALVYDLTPAEARIFELVCGGATPRKIAAELGVAPTTVRTHLQHVFQKTGCKRQVDLVKLAAGVSPPA
jgi:DNA-binding CsgD family transcriptional regulator